MVGYMRVRWILNIQTLPMGNVYFPRMGPLPYYMIFGTRVGRSHMEHYGVCSILGICGRYGNAEVRHMRGMRNGVYGVSSSMPYGGVLDIEYPKDPHGKYCTRWNANRWGPGIPLPLPAILPPPPPPPPPPCSFGACSGGSPRRSA